MLADNFISMTDTFSREKFIPSVQNHFIIQDKMSVQNPVAENNYPGKVLAEKTSCTGTKSDFLANHFLLLKWNTPIGAENSLNIFTVFPKFIFESRNIVINYSRTSRSRPMRHLFHVLEILEATPSGSLQRMLEMRILSRATSYRW